jgi:hypothetical protein
MDGKLKLFLGTVFVLALCVAVLAADLQKKPKIRSIYDDVPADAPGSELYRAPAGSDTSQPVAGVNYQTTCYDIQPQAGRIIEHAQVGDTWYEHQKNGSMGRMISVTSGGYRHISWMYCDHSYPPGPRFVIANCEPTTNSWIVTKVVDGGRTNAGFCNQTHLRDGTSLIIYHRMAGTPTWYSTIAAGGTPCSGSFSRHWDLPDFIFNAPSGLPGEWPKAEVKYDLDSGRDYIHIVMSEGNMAGWEPLMVAYERCYLSTGDTLICQSFEGGQTKTYRVPVNQTLWPSADYPISHFDSSCSVTPIVVVSPVSRRVAIAFMKPADPAGSCDYLNDACYIESMNNGDDWIAGTPWPPPEYNITNFGIFGNERGLYDLSACYDFQDSLHIVYTTTGFDPTTPHDYQPGVARLYHWSKKTGIGLITSAIWEGTEPGALNCNIAKMSISPMDPIYHQDSVYLYCIWTQFDTTDNAANGYTNGDIYGAGSSDGGNKWGFAFNLTNTKTPGCLPGDCLSENWSSLAQNLYNGNLHIEYICDKDAGPALYGEGQWMSNPVMYLELQPWQPAVRPFIVGDANGDKIVDVGDVVYLINYLYKHGSTPHPLGAGDATCNGLVDVGDVVYVINYLFKGGPAPSC